ncbi:MAG TPA: FKBP-type peptidyl-prolyl cis-trans isomerase, partial [Verrucomicrobiaceae bacterium]
MKNTLPFLAAAILSVGTSLPAQESKPAAAPAAADPAALLDKVSYFYGTDVARSSKENSVDIKLEAFIEGLKNTLEKKPSKYSPEELDAAMNQFAQQMVAKQQKDMAESGGKNKEEGDKFLADNAKREGVTTTKSGLQYEVLKKGEGKTPAATDTVTVHYHGTLVNGKVFDSSVERGEPASFPVNGVIPGWVEALQLMPVGSKWKLFIPSSLAYGERGAGRDIGP